MPAPEAAVSRSEFDYHGERYVLATMHQKERVIAPLIKRFLGASIVVPDHIDTDQFGTFSRDVGRTGSQIEAARAKIMATFDLMPECRLGLASEGSFGPHPIVPFLALDREVVVVYDRDTNFELVGYYSTPRTNFSHTTVASNLDARVFAEKIGFPDHGLIIMGSRDGLPAPDVALKKDISSFAHLVSAVDEIAIFSEAVHLETDMRAHRNPMRMRAIKRATIDLLRRFHSRCPSCDRPGFWITERIAGLPCKWCSAPTSLTHREVMTCAGCHLREERALGAATANPMYCGKCNP